MLLVTCHILSVTSDNVTCDMSHSFGDEWPCYLWHVTYYRCYVTMLLVTCHIVSVMSDHATCDMSHTIDATWLCYLWHVTYFRLRVTMLLVTCHIVSVMSDHATCDMSHSISSERPRFSVRRFLSQDASSKLVSSHILSRLDYCNCHFAGTSLSSHQTLQHIQNCVARLGLNKRTSDHITPLFRTLHWLPIRCGVN